MSSNQAGRPAIAVVGSGLAGTAGTVRLLKYLPTGSSITLYEREEANLTGGLAYSNKRTTTSHFLNLQAGRISMFREKRFDFINWARSSDRSKWPAYLDSVRSTVFEISTAVPRPLYQLYLRERLEKAVKGHAGRVAFECCIEEVVDIDIDDAGGGVKLATVRDGKRQVAAYDYVVLATGNLSLRIHEALKPFLSDPRVVIDQYALQSRERLLSIDDGDDVLILGSGLRSYDVVIDLLHERASSRRRGKVCISSRSARIHPVYSSDHEHDIVALERPGFLAVEQFTFESAVQSILNEFRRLYEKMVDVPENIRAERIVKGWEPWVPEFVKKAGPRVIRELHDAYWSVVTTSRIGMVNEIGQILTDAIASGFLEVIAGNATSVEKADDGKFRVEIEGKDSTKTSLKVDWIVNCLGRETDYRIVDDALWQSLIKKGVAAPHVATGRGIETGYFGTLKGPSSAFLPKLVAAGVMREGAETEQNGRLGSFVFSIGPVRNNALQAAASVILKIQVGHEIALWVEGLAGSYRTFPQSIREHFPLDRLGKLVAQRFENWNAKCRQWLVLEKDYSRTGPSPLEDIRQEFATEGEDEEEGLKAYAICLMVAVQQLADLSQVTTDLVDED
jgi:uncharacterized NAD(P)/FAD-binding protein YdhS